MTTQQEFIDAVTHTKAFFGEPISQVVDTYPMYFILDRVITKIWANKTPENQDTAIIREVYQFLEQKPDLKCLKINQFAYWERINKTHNRHDLYTK